MKNIICKSLAALCLTMSLTACGDKFLETEMYKNIDMETGLSSPDAIAVALNGAYYRLSQYPFAGNDAVNIGDIPTDIVYWNGKTNHWNSFYTFTYQATDGYLNNIWNYGYKVVDNSSRIIKASDAMMSEVDSEEQEDLCKYMAEAYALRAYAMSVMVNVFCHQVKVDGQDFSSQPGVVIVDEPVEAFANVQRATIGECYTAILNDLNNSLSYFDKAGYWSKTKKVFTPAAVYGLMARVKLYLEDYAGAADAAGKALAAAGITKLAYTEDSYAALYSTLWSNNESLFYLALDASTNWSANSCGTLYTTYNISLSPYLISLYGDDDIRPSIFEWADADGKKTAYGSTTPIFGGGKYGMGIFNGFTGGNPAVQTCYLINAPEMFLIQAEAAVKQNDVTGAQNALLVVAKRNLAITTVADLPSDAAGLFAFIKDERARELFQEGHRLWDLRRWNQTTNAQAYDAPNVKFQKENINLSNLVFPIPQAEIETGYGVTQNEGWSDTRP